MLHILKQLTEQILNPDQLIRKRYTTFKGLLNSDRQAHHLLAEIENIHYGGKAVDITRLRVLFDDFSAAVESMIDSLRDIAPGQYRNLTDYYKKIDFYGRFALAPPKIDSSPPYLLPLDARYDDDSRVGGKGHHLSHLQGQLELPVPEGFILSTSLWNRLIEQHNLREVIDRELAEVDIDSLRSLQQAAARLRHHILNISLPEQVVAEIARRAGEITAATAINDFAVRSSCVAEDSALSFAGQYLSLLHVEPDRISKAYLQVIASKYTPEAMLYRIVNGLDDEAVPMAVLVLAMVRARTSGVALARGVEEGGLAISVHAVTGFGDRLMNGAAVPGVSQLRLTGKEVRILSRPGEDTGLDDATLVRLARYGATIRDHYRIDQEIEWSYDASGNLFLLQSRQMNVPLLVRQEEQVDFPDMSLAFTAGETASPGIGCGQVVRVREQGRIPEVPDGSILVCNITPPALVVLLRRLNGVIARQGSPADHFSSVAREFGVPVLLQVGAETDLLVDGEDVVLHADRRTVYRGRASLPGTLRVKKQLDPESHVGRALKMVIDFTSPLGLLDPESADFTPENCRSLHDIIRFVHEKGVQAMFLHNPDVFFRKPSTIRLISDIPLQVYLIDVGDGLAATREDPARAGEEDIRSIPMRALWHGLSHPGVNWRDRSHFDWASYDAVALAGGIAGKDDAALASYCLLSREYLNISMRFGYHFTLLDCLCGEVPEENYILLRFAGGGGTSAGKDLRLLFVGAILEQLGFTCVQTGDLLDARLMRYDQAGVTDRMEQVGRLLGCVRLLDMVLTREDEIPLLVERFWEGVYDFSHE